MLLLLLAVAILAPVGAVHFAEAAARFPGDRRPMFLRHVAVAELVAAGALALAALALKVLR